MKPHLMRSTYMMAEQHRTQFPPIYIKATFYHTM